MHDLGEKPRPAHGAVHEVHSVEQAAKLEYSPNLDGLADPGEIVWAWVPYEEDPARGKDRPLLVVGRHGRRLLALMLSSREHDDSFAWHALGSGAWDREDRPSYLRLDRIFELNENDIRREGSVLDGRRFAEVAAVLMKQHGWAAPHRG